MSRSTLNIKTLATTKYIRDLTIEIRRDEIYLLRNRDIFLQFLKERRQYLKYLEKYTKLIFSHLNFEKNFVQHSFLL